MGFSIGTSKIGNIKYLKNYVLVDLKLMVQQKGINTSPSKYVSVMIHWAYQ